MRCLANVLTAVAGLVVLTAAAPIETPEQVYSRYVDHLYHGRGRAAAELMTASAVKDLRYELMSVVPGDDQKAEELFQQWLGATRVELERMSDLDFVGRFLTIPEATTTDPEARAVIDATRPRVDGVQYIDGVAHLYIDQTITIPPMTAADTTEIIRLNRVDRMVQTHEGWRLLLPPETRVAIDGLRRLVDLQIAERNKP